MNSSTDNKEIKKYSLKINFIFNFISQILVLIIPLITAPYLARILGAEVNGQISFSSSIVTYFILIASFGFATYGQREIAKYRDDVHQRTLICFEVVILRAIFTAISIAILLIITFANVFDEKYKTFILIESINVLACAVDPTFFYSGVEDFKSTAIKAIVIKVIGIAFIFLFVKTADDAWLYVLFNCCASLIAYLFLWPKIIKTSDKFSLRELNLKRHLWPAFLLFLPTLAVTIYNVIDKTMIGLLATNPDYENGCYEQATKITGMILILITIIHTIYIPRNTYCYANGDYDSLKHNLLFILNYVWLIGTPLICGVAVLAPSLCSWFLGDQYNKSALIMQILSVRYLCVGFGGLVGKAYFTSIGKEYYDTIATTLGAVIDVILNIFFIKMWGAVGASIATAICEFFVALFLLILAFKKKVITISEFFETGLKKIIATAIMFVPIFFMNQYFEYTIWTFLLITLVGCITYALSLLLIKDKYFNILLQKVKKPIKNKFIKRKESHEVIEENED